MPNEDPIFTFNLSGKQTIILIGVILGGPAYFSQPSHQESTLSNEQHAMMTNELHAMQHNVNLLTDTVKKHHPVIIGLEQ